MSHSASSAQTPKAVPSHGPRDSFAQLGAFLLDAGYAVTDVHFWLTKVAEKTGHGNMSIAVLPATVLVSEQPGSAATVVNATGVELPFSISARANGLVRELATGKVPVSLFPTRIQAIRDASTPTTTTEMLFGSAFLSAGLAMLFRVPWWAIVAALFLGALIGIFIHAASRIRGAGTIITFIIAFCSTLFVGLLASALDLSPIPLFAVCAPLAVLVPGATITNALLELSATDMVTGSSRLMYGLLILGFMSTGIGAAAMITGLRIDSSAANLLGEINAVSTDLGGWESVPPLWVSWIGVVFMAAGIGLAFKAGRLLTLLSIPAMVITYAGITLLGPLVGGVGATGIIGAVAFFLARTLERYVPRAPAIATFRPAFLLLVPGTVGLIALTTLDDNALITALGTFLSLSIGTKTGAVVADLVFRHEANPDEPLNELPV
ncbi:threonine/serine exporter family protein [Timonella sp. A28]|uniref:threonine/serine exporter family protein n=1 Tax=Timonella sp. A28 TaxID=3442640 RepID=UPI003EBE7D2B